MTIGAILAEPLVLHNVAGSRARRHDRVAELLQSGRARAGRSPALSARILRRPAAAHRHRTRARGRAASSSSATSPYPRSTFRSTRRSLNLLQRSAASPRRDLQFISHDLAVVQTHRHRIAVTILASHRREAPARGSYSAYPAPSRHPRAAGRDPGAEAACKTRPRMILQGDVPSVLSAAGMPFAPAVRLRGRASPG